MTIVLITGANTGLGLETAKALLQSPQAYTIILASRDIEKANTAAQQLQSVQSPSLVTTVQVDLEDDRSIQRAFDHVAEQYGRVDVLINNAGKVDSLK
jgi:NAD(P)-dependent dehydrogenase (short-subunit alcohol dehydrogenase family)